MRIAVMGAGSVGGYLGGMLARGGHDVSLIARGAHLAAIREHGLASGAGPRAIHRGLRPPPTTRAT